MKLLHKMYVHTLKSQNQERVSRTQYVHNTQYMYNIIVLLGLNK